MKEGEHPFWFLFPDLKPDPEWIEYHDRTEAQIKTLYEKGKLLDAYILASEAQIAFHSKEREGGNYDFSFWVCNLKFLELKNIYPDFISLYILNWMNTYNPNSNRDVALRILGCLIAMREGNYIPMSEESKKRIQKSFYIYCNNGTTGLYFEIVGEEDVTSECCNSERN